MIIGIVGKAGSGKDTVATMIPGAKRFSFADPLKELCAEVFEWEEQLWGPSELRNEEDLHYRFLSCWAYARTRLERVGGPWLESIGLDAKAHWPGLLAWFEKLRAQGTLSPRQALQPLGTEFGRAIDQDLWARAGVRLASAVPLAVFTDCRFVNEAEAIRAAGGLVWRVVRPGAGLAGTEGAHVSELEQDSPEMDRLITSVIDNCGTLEDLRRRVDSLL